MGCTLACIVCGDLAHAPAQGTSRTAPNGCVEGHAIHSAVLVPTLPFAAIHFLPVSLDLWKMATEYMLGKACIAEVRSAVWCACCVHASFACCRPALMVAGGHMVGRACVAEVQSDGQHRLWR